MRLVTTALVVAASLLFGSSIAQAQQIFRSGHSGDPDSLDPHLALTGTAIVVTGDLFEGLLTLDAHGKPVAGIAESWSVSPDGLEYEFQLRRGLRWSDGHPLVADDVVYSLRRLANPSTRASSLAVHVKPIQNGEAILTGKLEPSTLGVTAPDSHRVVVKLHRPTPYWLTVLALPAFAPVPQHVIEEHGNGWTQPGKHVSNGAFRLKSWIPQERVETVRNEHFREAASVRLDEVHYYPLDNLNTGFAKFRAGELDAMVNFPPERLTWLREHMPGVLRLSPSLGLYVYVLNHSRPPFDDPRVRRALNLVIDRGAITERLIRTGDKPAFGIVPPNVDNYFAPLQASWQNTPAEARLREARSLLAEAGYGQDNPLTFELLYHTSEEHKKVAIATSSMWQRIGVKANLINAERAVVDAAAKNGEFDVVRAAWFSAYTDAYGFLNYFESGSPANSSRYSNPAYDQLVRDANALQAIEPRAALLREAEEMLMADNAAIPMFYYVSRRLVARNVRGWEDDNLTARHPARYLFFADE